MANNKTINKSDSQSTAIKSFKPTFSFSAISFKVYKSG